MCACTREKKNELLALCGIHHSVLIKLGNFFHTYYYFSVYTHHKEQEGVALHTLAVCPPIAPVLVWSEEAWLGFVPSARDAFGG